MQEPKEVTEAYAQVILGNLWNHVRFWTFLGFVFLSVYGITRVVTYVPTFVSKVMGVE